MSRNVRGFMSLFHSDKPVVCKVHGFCVAGGTDMALCSDLLVIADDARIGYPPARVWGVPTTMLWAHRIGAEKAKRMLFTGDLITGAQAKEWGLAIEAPPAAELDESFEALVGRIAKVPVNQLVMMKLLVNQALYAQGLHATQALGTFMDGIARHTKEGYAFQQRAAEVGFKQAVRERDEPFDELVEPGEPLAQLGRHPRRREVALVADRLRRCRPSPPRPRTPGLRRRSPAARRRPRRPRTRASGARCTFTGFVVASQTARISSRVRNPGA